MKNLLKMTIAAMLLLTLPAAANAQFGNFGKKLKEKAKQKVEQKVNQTINNTVNSAVERTSDAIEGRVDKAVKKGKKKVADKVKETTGDSASGATGTGSFKSTDLKEISIFLPENEEKYQQFWGNTDEQDKKNRETFQRLMMAKGKNYGSETPAAFEINYIKLEDGTVVPEDEEFLNAWYCRFISNPSSYDAVKNALQALAYDNPESPLNKCNKYEPTGSYPADFEAIRKARYEKARKLLREQVHVDDIMRAANENKYYSELQDDDKRAFWNYATAFNTVEDVLPGHKDFASISADSNVLGSYSQTRNDLRHDADKCWNLVVPRASWMKLPPSTIAVSEPKGVTVSAALKQAGEKAARQFVGSDFEKIIFATGKWIDTKSNEWPYRVNGQRTGVYIIAKYNGKRYLLEVSLTKGKSTGYSISAPVYLKAAPLK